MSEQTILAVVLVVALGGIYFISGDITGFATADSILNIDTLGVCCCEGPTGVFKAYSGTLTSQLTDSACSLACAKEGSKNTAFINAGVC